MRWRYETKDVSELRVGSLLAIRLQRDNGSFGIPVFVRVKSKDQKSAQLIGEGVSYKLISGCFVDHTTPTLVQIID